MIVYRELSSLALDLGIKAGTLYAVSNALDRHYHKVKLPKANGEFRQLYVPDALLKHIQRRITEVLLVHVPVSPYATAYRYGGSTVRNAVPHVGKAMLLKLDIRNFFDRVLYSDVKQYAFPETIYAEPLRILLTMLCYHRDVLPQGAPSSPVISNIILRDFDNRVGNWCRTRGISYTRYCDDLTFSGAFIAEEVYAFAAAELRKIGFYLNGRKTHLAFSNQKQLVTGLVVNKKINVPRAYQRKLRQELYFCQRYGVSEHLRKIGSELSVQAYARKLLGQVNYVLQVSPENREMHGYRQWLLQVCKDI